jgi:hypothetical protein
MSDDRESLDERGCDMSKPRLDENGPTKRSRFRQVVGPIALAAGVGTVTMLSPSSISLDKPLMLMGFAEILIGLIVTGVRPIGRPVLSLFSMMTAVAALAFLFLVLQVSSGRQFLAAVLILALLRAELAVIWAVRECYRARRRLASVGFLGLILALPTLLFVTLGIVDKTLYRLQQARGFSEMAANEQRLSDSLPVGDPRKVEYLNLARFDKSIGDTWYDSACPDEREVLNNSAQPDK